jgi:NitT/TauT family transport system substrate-binding protein
MLVVSAAMALVLAACGSNGGGGNDVQDGAAGSGAPGQVDKIKVGILPIADTVGLFICADAGFCKEAGIELDFTTQTSGPANIAALQGGSIDVGTSIIAAGLQARQQGLSLKLLAPMNYESINNQGGPSGVLLVKDPNIKTGKDLEGKSFGVNAVGGGSDAWVMEWIAKTGGDPKKVTFTEVPIPNMTAAVEQGQIAGGQVAEPFRSQGLKNGLTQIAYSEQIQDEWPVNGLVATEKWLKGNPDLAKRLVGAFAKSQAFANENSAEVRRILTQRTQLGELANSINLHYYPTKFRELDITIWKDVLNRHHNSGITEGFQDAVWEGALK